MRHARQYRRASWGKGAAFFVVLFAFGIFSLLLPLRPKESVMEKRTLTEFPKFSWETLASGEYTAGIDTWFADTFPLRDKFFQLNNWVESLYGVKTVEIVGDVGQADEIPDAPFTGE